MDAVLSPLLSPNPLAIRVMDSQLVATAAVINQALVSVQTCFLTICAFANLSPWIDIPEQREHQGLRVGAARKEGAGQADTSELEEDPSSGEEAPETLPGKKKKKKRKAEAAPATGSLLKGHQAAAAAAGQPPADAEAEVDASAAAGEGLPVDSEPWWQPNPLESLGLAPMQAAPGLTPRRPWSSEEVMHLIQLVEDEGYRRRHLRMEGPPDFKAIGAHFGKTDQAARSKYYYWLKVERHTPPGEPRRREAAVRRKVSYGWMAVYALGQLPGLEGTGEQILRVIDTHPPFQPLDRTVRADSAGVERWRQRVREELSHRNCFLNTGRKVGGEAVWHLNLGDPQALPSRRPPKDLMPFLGRHGCSNG